MFLNHGLIQKNDFDHAIMWLFKMKKKMKKVNQKLIRLSPSSLVDVTQEELSMRTMIDSTSELVSLLHEFDKIQFT